MTELSASLVVAGALIQRLQDHGLLEERKWTISETPNSPWILVDAEPHAPYVMPGPRAFRFAVWRATGALYVVGEDGAVGDEPISLGDVETELADG